MKVLVTGSAGFLGYHLCEFFLSQKIPVVGIDNYLSGQTQNTQDLSRDSAFSFFKADINTLSPQAIQENKSLAAALSGVTHIYHMACPASPPVYQKDPLHTLETCTVGGKNMLLLAQQLKARILLASTSEIYGDPEVHPQTESYRGNVNTMGPRSCYDEGKRALETLGFIFAERGVEVRTVRIFNTYGPRMSPYDGRVITNFISQALKNEPLTVYGDGKQTRSFCYFSDLLEGLVSLMNSNVTEPVNIGSQFEFSILDVAQLVQKIVNPKLQIIFQPLPKDDPKQRRPNTERALAVLGWNPKVNLEQGLVKMIEYYKSIHF